MYNVAAPILTQQTKETIQSAESAKVFRWWDYPIFLLLTALNLSALVYFLSQWFSLSEWRYHSIIFTVLTLAIFHNILMYQLRWLTLPLMRRPRPMPPSLGWRVGVATTFVPGAESITMLEETLKALVGMDYPHDTWVLDEGDDDRVKALCRKLGVCYFSRKNLPQYQAESGTFAARTKHGNYNAWLYETGFDRYDIITAFDPDHVPHRDFLLNLLGYFDDPKIGYVQAAQAYYNQKASFIAQGAAEETYAYYSSIQMVSYTLGYPIVTGCHNAHRVTALKEVGGFAPHEADDLLITILYRARGWKGVYVPKILARGLTPVDWSGYLTQQRRWARSVLDIKLRVYPRISSSLPRVERLVSLFHGLYYLYGISTAIQIVLLAYMLISGMHTEAFSFPIASSFIILLVVLQSCEFYRQRFYLDPRREIGFHWRAGLLRVAKWPHILLALYDTLRGYQGPYTITRKVNSGPDRSEKGSRGRARPVLAVPHLLVAGLLGVAWVLGYLLGHFATLELWAVSFFVTVCSLGLSLTERMTFPDPYDSNLFAAVRESYTTWGGHLEGQPAEVPIEDSERIWEASA